MNSKYDIVGDIHGHADPLRRLLQRMDYRIVDGVFMHPDRRVIFVGDFIDRGPQQCDVLQIAKSMCDAGTALAVMGNHEFNALAWVEPDGAGGFNRPHTKQNENQHEAFLRQLGEGSKAYNEALKWISSLPIWLEQDGLRVVHACWSPPAQKALQPFLDGGNRFTPEGFREASRNGSDAYEAVEILLKGPEMRLPDEGSFLDKQGDERRHVRIKWWDPDATTLRHAALGMSGLEQRLPELPVTSAYRYAETTPVFFGHYWMQGRPIITNGVAACLDFSVAKEGYLAAYRWSGEQRLIADNLVYVPAS